VNQRPVDPQELIDKGLAKRYSDGSVRWAANVYGHTAGTFITRPANAGRRRGIPDLARIVIRLEAVLLDQMRRGKDTSHLLNAIVELRLHLNT